MAKDNRTSHKSRTIVMRVTGNSVITWCCRFTLGPVALNSTGSFSENVGDCSTGLDYKMMSYACLGGIYINPFNTAEIYVHIGRGFFYTRHEIGTDREAIKPGLIQQLKVTVHSTG